MAQAQVAKISIEEEIKQSYLDYAMSVIIGRALPDVRDGLKPVHRRILYSMYELKNDYNKPYKKSARIVGDVIGKYHPHGDAAVYDALVRMAQDFSLRYPLVDGQGNFGSIDGDPPAAMRYTEVRMTRLTQEFLSDIEKETVDFVPNYDSSLQEPVVLPTRVPNLLINGSSGIAVGMAANIPPHNLSEVISGIIALIDNPDMSNMDLMEYIKGPDFPSAGMILGEDGIREAYETGRGIIRIRARTEIKTTKSNKKPKIIIRELPYQVNKARLLEKIANLVKEKRIEGIREIRDESDREGLRVVLELRSGTFPEVILNQLYKFTQLEVTFGIILLAIVDNRPEVLSLKDALRHFIDFRRQVIIRRTVFDLKKAEERAHILLGLKLALENLDAVIELIKKAENPKAAKSQLMQKYSFTDVQAQAILDMRLQRLTGLEREKILREYDEIQKKIKYLKSILASDEMVLQIIKDELLEIDDKYGDDRKTEIIPFHKDLRKEDLIAVEEMVVTISHAGYIKRNSVNFYRNQKRGGKGRTGMGTRREDFVSNLFVASTHDTILFFTDRGRTYWLKVYEIPQSGPYTKGKAIVNLLDLQPGEKIATILPIKEFEEGKFVVVATRKGLVKKTPVMDYSNPRSRGIIGARIVPRDELISAVLTDGTKDLFLMSRKGKSIRFKETDVRPTGRNSMGVIGMDVDGSELVGMDVIEENQYILVVTEKGFGKRTIASEYRVQKRGGKGLINIRITERNGPVVGFRRVKDDDDVMLITDTGRIIRINVADVNPKGRVVQGVKLIDLGPDEKVVDIASVQEESDID